MIALRYPVRVGELSYQNTVPFRLDGRWNTMPCLSPRLLARWAEEGSIDAGVIPVVEAWRLEKDFEPVGQFGIAARNRVLSVVLYSRKPWTELDRGRIGLTDQTATSARLLQTLLTVRDGLRPNFREGFRPTDDARLLIGDSALTPEPGFLRDFPHAIDLAEEWHRWQGTSFVFARWMVRKSVSTYWKGLLEEALEASLEAFDRNRENMCRQAARALRLPASRMEDYYDGLVYRLTESERRGEALFRDVIAGDEKVRV